jgi:hypothetical protein
LIEADFQREYGIDLGASLGELTWRRFCVLLGGLSADSRLLLKYSQHGGKITNPKAAERALMRWAK